MGFPIRRSLDQSSFAAPQGISQRTTSFIASQRQGIHQMLLRHLITLTINVRKPSAKRADMIIKERPVFDLSVKDIFLLAKHIRRSRLRAVAGSQGLGAPLAEYAASLRFQTSASFRRRRESHDKIHRPKADGHRIQTQPRQGCTTKTRVHNQDKGGACRDRTDDLKLAKLPLSQLS